MNDTHPEIAQKVIEMMREKSPEECLKMGFSMLKTSKELVIAGILHENPGISKIALRRELFLRFYRDDFNAETREKILNYLDQVSG